MAQNIFEGKAIAVTRTEHDIAELVFDLKDDSVNKFNALTLSELGQAIAEIKNSSEIKGLLITSAKDVFIVGADVTEFLSHFKKSDEELTAWLKSTHELFNQIEDLPYPSVAAIGGVALGGGCELALSATYRVLSTNGQIGLPETKLGIFPGWGGTIRLPRLIGADNAIEWIAAGSTQGAQEALKVGAADAVVEPGELTAAARDLLLRAIKGEIDWRERVNTKRSPLKLKSPVESMMIFEGAKSFVAAKASPAQYPSPIEAIAVMQKCAMMTRDQAVDHEVKSFVKMTRTPTAPNLVTIFLSDQFNKKKSKKVSVQAEPVNLAAVLGAGIMGGGIAYQSASKGVPIIMKDISQKALIQGMAEAGKLLGKQVERKKIDMEALAKTLASIHQTLSYGDFGSVNIVVEAVVENEKIKKSVLQEVEQHVAQNAILTSNTSTISISSLASGLARPENFCGMHFFNPVHMMPLVEVIRGEKSSEKAVATTVAYALRMGKTPIVVGDCPGFLVNRILFPYFIAFAALIEDGVDFRRIDKVMTRFGWPMGPAHLSDVVGLDTSVHAAGVMTAGYPDRMTFSEVNPIALLAGQGRYGQKNGAGFYKYETDKRGKPQKSDDAAVDGILAPCIKRRLEVSDEEIEARMMLPLINESVRCLEDKIVETPMELDLSLVYGLGFPPFRGGALKYADSLGLARCVETSGRYENIAAVYKVPALLRGMADGGKLFYPM
jgi:3-hydroxyacyl-CoA dehydrogenase/enoyl-CoA hydratase/3-hydroxybutyryl-CoA epimerase/enoyl-CoA isomerase